MRALEVKAADTVQLEDRIYQLDLQLALAERRHSELRQARTSDGTTPSMVTPAASTNMPHSRPVGAPSNNAILARLIRLA